MWRNDHYCLIVIDKCVLSKETFIKNVVHNYLYFGLIRDTGVSWDRLGSSEHKQYRKYEILTIQTRYNKYDKKIWSVDVKMLYITILFQFIESVKERNMQSYIIVCRYKCYQVAWLIGLISTPDQTRCYFRTRSISFLVIPLVVWLSH